MQIVDLYSKEFVQYTLFLGFFNEESGDTYVYLYGVWDRAMMVRTGKIKCRLQLKQANTICGINHMFFRGGTGHWSIW